MHDLRGKKSDIEIALLQKACDITEAGFRRVLGFLQSGVMEFEVEAEFLHEFLFSVNYPQTPFNAGFGWITFAAFAGGFKRNGP